eukprot:6495022-Prymnesium_polylepis.2
MVRTNAWRTCRSARTCSRWKNTCTRGATRERFREPFGSRGRGCGTRPDALWATLHAHLHVTADAVTPSAVAQERLGELKQLGRRVKVRHVGPLVPVARERRQRGRTSVHKCSEHKGTRAHGATARAGPQGKRTSRQTAASATRTPRRSCRWGRTRSTAPPPRSSWRVAASTTRAWCAAATPTCRTAHARARASGATARCRPPCGCRGRGRRAAPRGGRVTARGSARRARTPARRARAWGEAERVVRGPTRAPTGARVRSHPRSRSPARGWASALGGVALFGGAVRSARTCTRPYECIEYGSSTASGCAARSE